MATNYFLVLGLSESADNAAIEAAYKHLSESFSPSRFQGNKAAEAQAELTLSKVRESYFALHDPNQRAACAQEVSSRGEWPRLDHLKPFIGHLCVAAGFITYQDLLDAISQQTDIDLPLGQILQEKQLITQTELEGMLMGQKLYGAPHRPLEDTVKRLLEIGLVNLDMVKIVLIDSRTAFGATTDELLVRRGYVQPSVVQALRSQGST